MVYCTSRNFGHYKRLAVLQFSLNYEQRKITFNATELFLKVFLLRIQRCKSFTMPYLNWVINIVAVEFSTSNMWQHVFVQIFVHSYLWRGGQICHHLTSKWCLQRILSIKNELLFARQNKTVVLGLLEFQQESPAAFLKSYFHLLNRDGVFFVAKNLVYLVKTKIKSTQDIFVFHELLNTSWTVTEAKFASFEEFHLLSTK